MKRKFTINNLQFTNKDKGFTLIELLVVISIIGVLSAVLMANISGIRERARDARRKSDLREIKDALRVYHNDYDDYPTNDSSGLIVGCGDGDTPVGCSWGSEFIRKGTTYMKTLPADPLSQVASPIYYTYAYIDRDNFNLKAVLDNKSDTDITKSQTLCNSSTGGTDYYVCAD